MSIHDLLTNLQVTPGFNPTSADEAAAKRESFDPAEGSEYRDRLARTINSPEKSSPQAAEPSPPANGNSDRPKPEALTGEQGKTAAKPAKKGQLKSAAPERETDSAPQPQPTVEKTDATTAAGISEADEPESVVVDQQPVTESAIETDSLIDSELSAAALALLTITAAAPIYPGINLEVPTAPPGVQELLGSAAVEPTGTLVPEVTTTDREAPSPPAGLVASFVLPGTASSTTSTETGSIQPAEQQGPSSDVSPSIEFQADVAALATLDGTLEVAETSQTNPLATGVTTQSSTQDAEVLQDDAASSTQSAHLERANAASMTSGVAAGATHSSDQTRANDEREQERARENEAHTRATVAKGTLQENTSDKQESSESEESNSVGSGATSRSDSPLPSIVDIITTELIVDEGQSTIGSSESGGKDPASDASLNPLLNSAPAPSRSPSTSTSTNAIAAGKISQHQAQQLVDRVSNALHQSAQTGQSLKVRLSPPELGVLQIEVTQRDGVLSARLEAQTASAHQTLVDNLSSLREALAQTGTVVERIEVHIAPNRGSDNSQDQSDGRRQNTEQQNPQRRQRRDDGEQNKNDKREPLIRKGVRSMDQLDIQI